MPNHHHTMSLQPPHILALPREIRNKIYTHLSQSITFDWKWRVTNTKRTIFTVHIPCAPRLSLLLVCSRFCSELLEHLGKRLILHWVGGLHQRMRGYTTSKEGKDREKKYEGAFRGATSVVVLTRELDWGVMSKFCGKVRRYVPCVKEIVVCEKVWVAGCSTYEGPRTDGIRLEHLPARLSKLRGDYECVEQIPARLTDLQFVQFGRSVRVGAEVLWTHVEHPQGYHRYLEVSGIWHKVEKMDVYSFAGQSQRACIDQKDVELFWTFWPVTKVSSDILLPVHDEESIERFRIPTWDKWLVDGVTIEEKNSLEGEGFARWFE
jgi:hypothetical protein